MNRRKSGKVMVEHTFLLFFPEDEDGLLSSSDMADLLDRQKCLAALAELRHAKWFQVQP